MQVGWTMPATKLDSDYELLEGMVLIVDISQLIHHKQPLLIIRLLDYQLK